MRMRTEGSVGHGIGNGTGVRNGVGARNEMGAGDSKTNLRVCDTVISSIYVCMRLFFDIACLFRE